jgi:mannose/fructose/N-acetylgalactosamine-specific phosphotransferase system component IIC
LSALISEPSVAPEIVGIVVGSTVKGLIAGALIGWFARKVNSTAASIAFGVLVAGFFAFLVAYMDGRGYYWQMMLPGCVLGVIVGYATQKYGTRAPA